MHAVVRAVTLCVAFWLGAPPAIAFGEEMSDREEWRATELSRLSKLSEPEIRKLLADCSANQTSLYFCTWRDKLVADHILSHTVETRILKEPHCENALRSKVSHWQKARTRTCESQARNEWGEGSMFKIAVLECMKSKAEALNKRLLRSRSCTS